MDKEIEKQINRADSLLRRNKPLEAVLILKKIVEESPDFDYAHYLLGIARLKCGLYGLAKKSFEEADRLRPSNPENLRSLGWAKVLSGNIEEGRNDLRNAINLNLTDYKAYLDLAMSYFNFLDFDEGFAWLNRAMALNPGDKFMKENYKFSEKMRKEFLAMPEEKQNEIKNDKSDNKIQKKMRLAILEKCFGGEGIGAEAANELMNELELSGLDNDMLLYKDDVNAMKWETKESILEKRKEIEKNLLVLIEESKSKITLDDIKDIIYHEKSHHDLDKIFLEFDKGQDPEEIEKILYLINDAWNYFPHKCLKGLSPAEMISRQKK